MRYYVFTDDAGCKRRVLLRDKDPDNARIGIPSDIPDLAGLGLTDEARRDLHNLLFGKGLFTWQDVMAQGNGVQTAVGVIARQHAIDDPAALKREVVRRYRQGR